MPVENAQYIDSLNASYPGGGDAKSQGDDHIKLIKATLKATFPNIKGAVERTHTQLNKAPHDKASLIELLGQRIVTSEQFSGVSAAQDIALGYHTETNRLRARVGGHIYTPALAYLSDIGDRPKIEGWTCYFGSGVVLQRYPFQGGTNQPVFITFTPELREVPFLILPQSFVGSDGADYLGGPAAMWSVGGTAVIEQRSRTGCAVNVKNTVSGAVRGAVYVLGQLK